MENIKLTLNVKADSLRTVKEYAKRRHTSLSKIVQKLFDEIVEQEESEDAFLNRLKQEPVAPEIAALRGILKGKVPDDVNLWDYKYEYLKEKHGL
ncbi:DUF6364 family protein [Mucilaginibacter psychrotolerans]|uniref:Uncharacterized protein n=1 Tax=Mucilaginibacter psychrotolerans TaxID=1524096 RepID=A0A4Y8SIL7_9SPHI|nr:DUF6364 family protein [Mucilaginibacter psychrotolerans]TFF38274.1 hypothetical protein E2R66_09580 [Mucilaginibacter psychrotolerans]